MPDPLIQHELLDPARGTVQLVTLPHLLDRHTDSLEGCLRVSCAVAVEADTAQLSFIRLQRLHDHHHPAQSTSATGVQRQLTSVYELLVCSGSLALDANSLRVTGPNPVRASITVLITNLPPGLTVTYTAVYKVIGGNGAVGTFNARQIIVIPN